MNLNVLGFVDQETIDHLVEMGQKSGKVMIFCDSWHEDQARRRLNALGIYAEESVLDYHIRHGNGEKFLQEEEARLDVKSGEMFGKAGAGI